MLSAIHRFKGHASLRYVYSKGRTYRDQNFALKVTPNKKRESYRLAVVVSKKVNKSSVVRNRIRRRIYELVRKNEGKINQPYDMVVTIFNDSVASMPSKELEESFTKLLSQASIIIKSPKN